ncbi:unnamed protein product [Ambrosiozyma monospora]|uniref:Unnamed protein product n=1 Tax=Ambrosiozyma monospora TaxID=43982 RepID=A0ACB5T1H4_AMBMO|nr:unnamed protein product [Ambrosiozyma monospora]
MTDPKQIQRKGLQSPTDKLTSHEATPVLQIKDIQQKNQRSSESKKSRGHKQHRQGRTYQKPPQIDPEKDVPPQPAHQKDGKIDTSNLRRSNRISRSCFSCKKRKVKCNFEIPCDRCISRNRAHLCSREPVVVDGLLVNNPADEKELKFSQENEVLKRKIKELEETILKLKEKEPTCQTQNNDVKEKKGIVAPLSGTKRSSKTTTNFASSYSKIEHEPPQKKQKISAQKSSGIDADELLIESRKWDSYAITVSLLTKGLAEGMHDGDNNLNFNTEEWAILHKKKIAVTESNSGDSNLNSKVSCLTVDDNSKSRAWKYHLKIINKLGKRESDIIIGKAFSVSFMFNVVDEKDFMKEYEDYWANESFPDKHITPLYSKESQTYLFLSQYYTLMCIGMYYSDESLQEELGFTDEEWDLYPRACFSCALESLYRGKYMTHMKFETVQTGYLLKMCAHPLGGIHLLNCVNLTAGYVARELNLDKIKPDTPNIDENPQIQLRIKGWWSLVVHDWFESHGRFSTIPQGKLLLSKRGTILLMRC